MTQQELDVAYTQSNFAPNIARWRTNISLIRNYTGDPLRLAYGDRAIEAMDVYRTGQPQAPVHIVGIRQDLTPKVLCK